MGAPNKRPPLRFYLVPSETRLDPPAYWSSPVKTNTLEKYPMFLLAVAETSQMIISSPLHRLSANLYLAISLLTLQCFISSASPGNEAYRLVGPRDRSRAGKVEVGALRGLAQSAQIDVQSLHMQLVAEGTFASVLNPI